jgi:hypothetical protein
MKGVNIYPGDIGAHSEWDESWIKFISKFGFTAGTPWELYSSCSHRSRLKSIT